MAKTSSRGAPAGPKKAASPKRAKGAAKKPSAPAKKAAPPKKPRASVAPSLREPGGPEAGAAVLLEPVPVTEPSREPLIETLPPLKALPEGEPQGGATFPFEIDPKRIEEGLGKLRQEVVHWANKGRYTKVRFKFRGKQLLPDLPIAAVAAAEGLTFYWGGILRALVFTVAGGSLLQVELINDADKRVQAGKEALLTGDLDEALALFREALAMDRDNAGAHLNVGVALKLRGERDAALAAFERFAVEVPNNLHPPPLLAAIQQLRGELGK